MFGTGGTFASRGSDLNFIKVIKVLNQKENYPKHYFYPFANNLKYLNNNSSVPISDSIPECVLCLPLYTKLLESELDNI